LEQSETTAVLEYLEQCKQFWEKTEILDKWISQILAGKPPNFSQAYRVGLEPPSSNNIINKLLNFIKK